MDPIESSETSAYINTLTPGTYPKEKKLRSIIYLQAEFISDDAAICSQFYSTARFTLHVSGVLYSLGVVAETILWSVPVAVDTVFKIVLLMMGV